jgi:hypothetical protein
MATARANKQHRLSPTGWPLWTSLVYGLLAFLLLLLIGGGATLVSSAHEHLSTQTHNASEPEETEGDETATMVATPVGAPRSRNRRAGFSPTRSNASLLLLNTGSVPNSLLLISALPVGAFAKRNGVGNPMRC